MLMFDWKKAFRGNKVNNNCKIPTDNLKSSSDSLKEDWLYYLLYLEWMNSMAICFLEELQNYDGKLFFCLPENAICISNFTLGHIKLNIYIKKN